MKKISSILIFFPLFVSAQLAFKYPDGATVGRSKVMTLPASLFSPGTNQGQLLIFYPPAYAAGKLCGLFLFSAGDGEQVSLDVSEVNKNSLPRMIAAGMTPYSILPNKDTLFWIVVSIHSNNGSAFRSQLAQIVPWILDKSGIRHDSTHRWATGLSGGGSATWALTMIGPALSGRMTGIMPMANGGYDDFLKTLQGNLITVAKNGMYFWPYIGTQDPGYNGSGFFAYNALLMTYALPDHYHPHVIIGGRHDASTWDVPFNSRVMWDSIGLIGYKASVNPVHARIFADSVSIHYPNTSVALDDSTTGNSWVSWGCYSYPTGYPGRWVSYGPQAGMLLANLVQGSYGIQYVAGDDNGHTDTARIVISVTGPAPCPVCPPQRSLVGMSLVNGLFVPIYSDGKP